MPKLKLTLIGLKALKHNQPIGDWDTKIAWVIDTLCQHAITQSQTRETRHAIPTCYAQTSYLSMQSANWKPDTMSQYAVAKTSYPSMWLTNWKPGKLDTLSCMQWKPITDQEN